MGKEIERKFLVQGDTWRKLATPTKYRQGYLSAVKERVVRVRTIDRQGFLTIKGITTGFTRKEFEYEIPFSDAEDLLDSLCERPLIEKNRYRITIGDLVWEVDEFFGANAGLVIAEVELKSEDQVVELPDWIGKEVSGDPRYFNSNLIAQPFTTWPENR
jgi:CYTH domain-containing protein